MGELLVPVAEGTVNASANARAGLTGLRDSVIAAQRTRAGEAPESVALVPQQEIDDPRLDERFPDTPLSRVRKALRWRMDEVGVFVDAPLRAGTAGRTIQLHRAGCRVTAPPRYVHCPSLSEQMSPTLDALTRVAPPGTTARLIEVWRVDAAPISGWSRRYKLESLAIGPIKLWEREGASDIEVSGPATVAGGPRIRNVRPGPDATSSA